MSRAERNGGAPRRDLTSQFPGLSGWQNRADDGGFILTGPDLMRVSKRPKRWMLDRDPFLWETNVPGIFAGGDVRRRSVKHVASGVGEASVAVLFISQYLNKV